MRLLKFLLVLSLVGFAQSLALADATGSPPAADPYLLYYPLVATLLGSLGAFVRNKTQVTGFWHQWYGHALLTLIGAVAGSLAPLFETGHVTKPLLISALVGGGVTYLSAYKTQGKTDNDGGGTTKLAFVLPLVFVGFATFSCAHATPEEKAFGSAYAACMEAKGLAVAPSVAQETWGDLNGGANQAQILSQLEALAGKAGLDGVTCAVQAWLTPSSPSTTTPAPLAAKNPAGLGAASEFLRRHAVTTATVQSRG